MKRRQNPVVTTGLVQWLAIALTLAVALTSVITQWGALQKDIQTLHDTDVRHEAAMREIEGKNRTISDTLNDLRVQMSAVAADVKTIIRDRQSLQDNRR
jgi:hypothetical protein